RRARKRRLPGHGQRSAPQQRRLSPPLEYALLTVPQRGCYLKTASVAFAPTVQNMFCISPHRVFEPALNSQLQVASCRRHRGSTSWPTRASAFSCPRPVLAVRGPVIARVTALLRGAMIL